MTMSSVAARLRNGETVTFRPVGNSMTPRVRSKDLVTVRPYAGEHLKVGDVVLATVKGNIYLHLVSALDAAKDRVQIANNHGYVNGWTQRSKVWGVAIEAEGRPL